MIKQGLVITLEAYCKRRARETEHNTQESAWWLRRAEAYNSGVPTESHAVRHLNMSCKAGGQNEYDDTTAKG